MASLTIKSGESISEGLDMQTLHPTCLHPPSTLADETARVAFYVSLDGREYCRLQDSKGAEFVATVSESNACVITLLPQMFYPYRWIKIETLKANKTTPVPQDEDKVFEIGINSYKGG